VQTSMPNSLRHELLVRRANEVYHDLQADSFDEIHYYRHMIEQQFWTRDVLPRLVPIRGGLGVDLCSGTGFVPKVLLERLDNDSAILCFDVSEMALRKARDHLAPYASRVAVLCGDVAGLPVRDVSADWVTLNAGLHHVPEPGRVFGEIDRVLKVGGYFCLGFEPNAEFFSSRVLPQLQKIIWHAFWYLSPHRNFYRLRRWLGRPRTCAADEHLCTVNSVLLREGLIEKPLSLAELRGLVDVRLRADEDHGDVTGFAPQEIIARYFPHYTVELVIFGDYGGEMVRRHPWLRGLLDNAIGALWPRKGMLFSLIIRKSIEMKGPRG
jgi:ubiquinone/menaquinone biosynthesis C-methylase UbiE